MRPPFRPAAGRTFGLRIRLNVRACVRAWMQRHVSECRLTQHFVPTNSVPTNTACSGHTSTTVHHQPAIKQCTNGRTRKRCFCGVHCGRNPIPRSLPRANFGSVHGVDEAEARRHREIGHSPRANLGDRRRREHHREQQTQQHLQHIVGDSTDKSAVGSLPNRADLAGVVHHIATKQVGTRTHSHTHARTPTRAHAPTFCNGITQRPLDGSLQNKRKNTEEQKPTTES